MRSGKPGAPTSHAEVVDVTADGFTLVVDGGRHRVAFSEFPWFRGASAAEIADVHLDAPGHLRWPALDVDLALESIEHPERFPLVSRVDPPPQSR
jgi:hypothetical protein